MLSSLSLTREPLSFSSGQECFLKATIALLTDRILIHSLGIDKSSLFVSCRNLFSLPCMSRGSNASYKACLMMPLPTESSCSSSHTCFCVLSSNVLLKFKKIFWVWRYKSVIPEFLRLRQENHKSEVSLGSKARLPQKLKEANKTKPPPTTKTNLTDLLIIRNGWNFK